MYGFTPENEAAFVFTNQSHPWAIWLCPGEYNIEIEEWKYKPEAAKYFVRINEYKQAPQEALDFFAVENYKQVLYKKVANQQLQQDSFNYYFTNYLWQYAQKVRKNNLLQHYTNQLPEDKYSIAFLNKLGNLQSDKKLSIRQKQMSYLLKGKKLDDFSLKTNKDSLFQLYNTKAKYILLDFWSSWCGPCRRKHPYFVNLYNQYKNKGFTIISISVDDNKLQWTNAIAKDKLSWYNVSELKGWKNTLSDKYGITTIPFNILLNDKFEIVTTNASLGVIEAFLKEVK